MRECQDGDMCSCLLGGVSVVLTMLLVGIL
jgi:hypothetical protein